MQHPAPRFVASSRILWLRDDGTEVELTARVGEPYQVDAHTWACPAALDGVDGRYPDIYGACSLQSLNLAVRLIATRLANMLADGEQLAYPEDRSPWDGQSLAHVFGEAS